MHRDNIARAVAISYFFLGGYYLQDFVEVDTQTIACASVAAFILVGADALRLWIEKFLKNDKWIYIVHVIFEGINSTAFLVLLVFPFVEFDFMTKSKYEDIGTATSLAGLGISIYLLAKKNEEVSERKNIEREKEFLQIFKACKELINENQAINKETQDFMKSQNEELKALRDIIKNYDIDKKD